MRITRIYSVAMRIVLKIVMLIVCGQNLLAQASVSGIRFCCIVDETCSSNDTAQLEKIKNRNNLEEISDELRVLRGDPCTYPIYDIIDDHKWGLTAVSCRFEQLCCAFYSFHFLKQGAVWKKSPTKSNRDEEKYLNNTNQFCIQTIEDRAYLLLCYGNVPFCYGFNNIYCNLLVDVLVLLNIT